jgi:hypothetical protein
MGIGAPFVLKEATLRRIASSFAVKEAPIRGKLHLSSL